MINDIEVGSWIFANAIFGERAYKVLSIKHNNHGALVGTSYGTATFSLCLGGDNWRFATMDDIA